jgi:hydroxymethylpyrimidine/phosphomethylpyrimidine kinase
VRWPNRRPSLPIDSALTVEAIPAAARTNPTVVASPSGESTSTHGTGDTLASAIAALLARGETLESAIVGAKS